MNWKPNGWTIKLKPVWLNRLLATLSLRHWQEPNTGTVLLGSQPNTRTVLVGGGLGDTIDSLNLQIGVEGMNIERKMLKLKSLNVKEEAESLKQRKFI